MNKQVFRQNLAAGIVVVGVAAAAFVLSFEMPGSASIFPRIASSILFLLGFLLSITSILGLKRDTETGDKPVHLSQFINPAITLLIVLGYVLGMKTLGFYTSTVLMLMTFMYFMGITSIKTILIVTVIVTALVYLVFSVQLRVPLPTGVLL